MALDLFFGLSSYIHKSNKCMHQFYFCVFSADGSSQQNDELRLSHEEEEEEEENLGRRRGSRRRVQVIRQPRQNFRPQVGI